MAADEAKVDYGVEDMKQIMMSLFMNRESADLTLSCGSQMFKIHSFILCPRSTFFKAALEGGFKEGLAKRIELPEDNPLLISKMICYCYTTDYEFDWESAVAMGYKDAFIFRLHSHVGMYAMAEKFDLKNLKELAKKKFITTLNDLEPPVNETLTHVLDVTCFICSTTLENDRGLRDLVVGYVARNSYAFLALPQFKTFMAANMDFIMEVIAAKENICSRCKTDAAWEKWEKEEKEEKECSSWSVSNDAWQ